MVVTIFVVYCKRNVHSGYLFCLLCYILPSKGICNEVIGIASLTLCWNTVSESKTVTPERSLILFLRFEMKQQTNHDIVLSKKVSLNCQYDLWH